MEQLKNYKGPQVTDQGLVYTVSDNSGGDDCVLIVRSIPDKQQVAEQAGGLVSWVLQSEDEDDEHQNQVIYCYDHEELDQLAQELQSRADESKNKMVVEKDQSRIVIGSDEGESDSRTRYVLWKDYSLENLDELVQKSKVLVWFAGHSMFQQLAYPDRTNKQIDDILKSVQTDMPMDQLRQFFQNEQGQEQQQSEESKKPKKKLTRQQRRALLMRKK